tara:strand:- start:77 stop:541 length:465 start_codon:yes stop_codon:yes gene_type:complete
MIITCPYCDKKFNVDAELIPAEGRKLQCGSCDRKWHYKLDNTNLENDDKKNDVKIKTDELSKNEIPSEVERIITDAEKSEVNNKDLNKVSVKKVDRIAFFNLFIVILISFSAFIILLDTFKNPIESILPGFNFMLDNFYETLKDLFLFFKDLTR